MSAIEFATNYYPSWPTFRIVIRPPFLPEPPNFFVPTTIFSMNSPAISTPQMLSHCHKPPHHLPIEPFVSGYLSHIRLIWPHWSAFSPWPAEKPWPVTLGKIDKFVGANRG